MQEQERQEQPLAGQAETYSGYIVDVVGNRIFKGEITVADGKIAALTDMDTLKKDDVPDRYIALGLVDAHIHIESTMLTKFP